MNADKIFAIINQDQEALEVLSSVTQQALREGKSKEEIQKVRDFIALCAIYKNPTAFHELSEQVWQQLNR